eukprot:365252-Chlamydomonas_euryale.AAC.7
MKTQGREGPAYDTPGSLPQDVPVQLCRAAAGCQLQLRAEKAPGINNKCKASTQENNKAAVSSRSQIQQLRREPPLAAERVTTAP